jgi:hypothetical protein
MKGRITCPIEPEIFREETTTLRRELKDMG